jgi:hypothetical protein
MGELYTSQDTSLDEVRTVFTQLSNTGHIWIIMKGVKLKFEEMKDIELFTRIINTWTGITVTCNENNEMDVSSLVDIILHVSQIDAFDIFTALLQKGIEHTDSVIRYWVSDTGGYYYAPKGDGILG